MNMHEIGSFARFYLIIVSWYWKNKLKFIKKRIENEWELDRDG